MSKKKEAVRKKRDLDRYPALNPRLNAKTRFEVLDMDYIKKLDDKSLQYLNQFMAEYVSGAFKKNDEGDYSKENFHKTIEERRECYNRNNTRNRCGLTISNATGQTLRFDDINDFIDNISCEEYVSNPNAFSDKVHDEYDGDYDKLEEELLQEMFNDYLKCINPKSNSDIKMSESNYGKYLISKFNKTKLVKEND